MKMLLTELYLHTKSVINNLKMDEAVVQQYQPGFIDSLQDYSFPIIKEPTNTYFVGFPFNLHLNTVEEIINALQLEFSEDVIETIRNLKTYQCLILSYYGNVPQPINVSYLYSIPSYSRYYRGLGNRPPLEPHEPPFYGNSGRPTPSPNNIPISPNPDSTTPSSFSSDLVNASYTNTAPSESGFAGAEGGSGGDSGSVGEATQRPKKWTLKFAPLWFKEYHNFDIEQFRTEEAKQWDKRTLLNLDKSEMSQVDLQKLKIAFNDPLCPYEYQTSGTWMISIYMKRNK